MQSLSRVLQLRSRALGVSDDKCYVSKFILNDLQISKIVVAAAFAWEATYTLQVRLLTADCVQDYYCQ